jgi:hypothetical protein
MHLRDIASLSSKLPDQRGDSLQPLRDDNSSVDPGITAIHVVAKALCDG